MALNLRDFALREISTSQILALPISANFSDIHTLQVSRLRHKLVCCNFILPKLVDHRISFRARDWRNCSILDFNKHLSSSLSQLPTCPATIDNYVDAFRTSLLKVLNNDAPFKIFYQKSQSKPWINKDLSLQMKGRDELYHKYRRNKYPEVLSEYKATHKYLRTTLKTAKHKFLNNCLHNSLRDGDARSFWYQLSRLGLTKPSTSSALNYFKSLFL